MPDTLKVAAFCFPLPYGLFTVFRNLRAGLAAHGIQLRWVTSSPVVWDNPEWALEQGCGEVVQADPNDKPAWGAALARHVLDQGYQALIINPPQDPQEMNLVRYLPPQLRRIMVVHNVAPGVYRPLRSLRQYVHATVGVSPRIRQDLVRWYGFSPQRTLAIPNALDFQPYENLQRCPPGPGLRLLSFGRLAETQKGIFWLPRIMDRLADLDVRLTIAGDGPDGDELRRRCAHLGDRVRFLGVVPPRQIPQLVAQHDVFLMPSRCEGFGYTIAEAMAGGCVPVVSRLRAVTDFILDQGRTGFLFGVGDVTAAAAAVRRLHADPALWARMSAAARLECRQRFNVPTMGDAYAQLIRDLMQAPPPVHPPLPLAGWAYPRSFQPSLARRVLPTWLQNWIRQRLA